MSKKEKVTENANTEGEVVMERTKKVSMTEIIRDVITNAEFLTEESKIQLKEAIEAKVRKVTKPSARKEIEKVVEDLIRSSANGLSAEDIAEVVAPKFPELTPFSFNVKLFMILQPAQITKWGMEKTKDGVYQVVV
jgi:hypothetical protein